MNFPRVGRLRARMASVVVITVASLFVGGMGMVSLRAAGGTPFDAIMQSLNAMSTSLAAISNTLGVGTDPEPQEVKLSTGSVYVDAGQSASCVLQNGSDHEIEVGFRLVDIFGPIRVDETLLIPSGVGMNFGAGPAYGPDPVEGFFRCEFTFTGFANDVRGTVNVHDPGLAITVTADAR